MFIAFDGLEQLPIGVACTAVYLSEWFNGLRIPQSFAHLLKNWLAPNFRGTTSSQQHIGLSDSEGWFDSF